MNKPKHIKQELNVYLIGGSYPLIRAGVGKAQFDLCEINWHGNRQSTIATALLFAQSPKMFEVLRRLLEWEKEAWENDDDINGGDAVDFVAQLRVEAHEALAPYINHPILNQKDGLSNADTLEGG